jgi:TIR domain/Protein of unknown function (DUF1566)
MAEKALVNRPRIFISHAWEDKPLVRRLETELKAAGVEVWVDHIGIRGGDNLPERISEALEWCNTLLLIWSDAGSQSRWVKLEWTNAISLEKAIIPCLLGTTKLPGILAHKAYIDFQNIDRGIGDLLHALNLVRQTVRPTPISQAEKAARVLHNQLTESPPSTKPRPPQFLLRSEPLDELADNDVRVMLKEKEFFHSSWNSNGKGLPHQYEAIKQEGQKLVIDHATGLIWQQSGSPNSKTYTDAKKYIRQLNASRFAGYNDWRLPTLEETMSLMESEKHGELYLDPIFDRKQWWIWTADKTSVGRAWFVLFYYGYCINVVGGYDLVFVRAVRS